MVRTMAQTIDPEQLTGQVLQLGVIASVDHARAACTVESGDVVTGSIPWLAPRAGALRVWSPPTVGEQCLILAPEGDLDSAIALVGLWCDAYPAPASSADTVELHFADGAILSYDSAAHALAVTLPSGATAALTATGGVNITGDTHIAGDVSIDGDLSVTGKVTADVDVIGAGKSLKSHVHGGVQGGSAQTGAPV